MKLKKWRRGSCLLTVKSQSLNSERILLTICHLVATSGNIMSSWPDNPDRVWRFFWGANWTWFDHWCSLHLPLGQSTQWKQSGDHLGTLSRYWVSKETCTPQCARYDFRSELHSPFLSVHLKIIVCSFCNLVKFWTALCWPVWCNTVAISSLWAEQQWLLWQNHCSAKKMLTIST